MSTHNSTKIDQKEYLRKYLSGDTKKKKKKDKKHKIKDSSIKVKIIDDDAQTNDLDIDEELLLGGEDAPQIVGTYIEEKSNGETGNKWKSIAIKDEPEDEKPKKLQGPEDLWGKRAADLRIKDEFSPPRRKETFGRNSSTSHRTKKGSSDDMSPPRRKQRDQSPPRNRGNHSKERSSKNVHSDESPPRRKTKELKEKTKNSPRRSRFTDQSPPRKRHISSDQSPERHKSKTSADQTPPRRERNRSSDQSPTRHRKKIKDQSPQTRRGRSPSHQPSVSHQNSRSSNNPFRMKLEKQSVDLSPQRRRNSDQSPPRRRKNSDQSPPRRSIRSRSPITTEIKREKDAPDVRSLKRQDGERIRRTRWQKSTSRSPSPPPTHKPKMTKTLDGKHAGLQDAHALKSETNERRHKEEQFYAKMSDDISGRDAEVQMRKTGSGRLGRRARAARELDPEEQSRKEKHEKHKKELYDRWGKGLKQIEAHQAKTAEEQYEGSKPLARYTNDEDLERHLREQEHADDPMLEYMRQKKKEHQKHLNLPTVPIYQGSFPENRFSIRPGYRWDGVDRSNGYEKKWFDKQSEKLAVQDEAYKYSVEDM